MATLDRDVAQVKFVDLPGYRMGYREWGDTTSSKAWVLVHGITSSSLSWSRVAQRMAARSRVIAVDQKGHGDSDRPPTGYGLTDQAAEVDGLCRALGLQDVSLMGHSWGGGVALLVATSGDTHVQRLVLEDPGVGQRTWPADEALVRQKRRQAYIDSVGLSREEAEALVRPNLTLGWTEEDVAGKIDAAMKGSREAVQAVFVENQIWDVIDRFALLKCPTLMIRAEVAKGGIVGEEALAAAQANPLVRIVTVPDADHNIHRGSFEAFMAEVEKFAAEPQLR